MEVVKKSDMKTKSGENANGSPTIGKGLRYMSPSRLVAIGFALLILLGAFLLMLPFSSRDGEWTDFVTALFTATSATCVTGLTLVDTYAYWSVFGQIVLLFLIQVGGLGFITIVSGILIMAGRQLGMRERSFLKESFNAEGTAGLIRLLKKVLRGTLLVESIGAVILTARFYPLMGLGDAVYFGIFHSVSAFCNAGFDLMGKYGMSSFCGYKDDPIVVITICALILIGGLGFVVWDDLVKKRDDYKNGAVKSEALDYKGKLVNGFQYYKNGRLHRRYTLQTKIVLFSTALLVIAGTAGFLLLEWNNTFSEMAIPEKILNALFCAVTPRTAGFNTVDYGQMTESGKFLTILLMVVGGGSGSTAGGVKMTTVFVLLVHLYQTIGRGRDVSVFGRRIDESIVSRASAVLMMYALMITAATLVISGLQNLSIGDTAFEVVSAVCTVGITAGLTRKLCLLSRFVLIVLMYMGRLGSLSFALMFTENVRTSRIKLPKENISIG